MKVLLLLAFFIITPMCRLSAQEDDLRGCPIPSGIRVLEVRSNFFQPFSLGGSLDLPGEEAEEIRDFVSSAGKNDLILIRGTADDNSWQARREKEFHRLDNSLADARANWAWEVVDRRGLICESFPRHESRGVFVYIVEYSLVRTSGVDSAYVDQRIDQSEFRIYSDLDRVDRRVDNLEDRVNNHRDSGFYFGGGVGFNLIKTGDEAYPMPTASLVFLIEKPENRWEVTLTGGWKPMEEDSVFGKKSQTLAEGEISFYPRDLVGLAIGARGNWEVTRETDEYLSRAYGGFAGLRIQPIGQRFTIGADIQYSNQNILERDDSWWEWGFAVSARFNYIFR